jgi:transketolase C-terminal domain/subunit
MECYKVGRVIGKRVKICLKLLDKEVIIRSAIEIGCIVIAEEHNVLGGLGEVIAGVLSKVKV